MNSKFFRMMTISFVAVCIVALLAPQAQDVSAKRKPKKHTALPQQQMLMLGAGEIVSVECGAYHLAVERVDALHVILNCEANDITPTAVPATETVVVTDTPLPLTDTPVPPTETTTAIPATATLLPPTDTPTAVPPTNFPTKVPTATATVSGSIPLCPDHDPKQWHPLYDAARKCHYDHTHNADPHTADSIFGAPGALWGGQEISYPFATSAMENVMKHGGYKYAVRLNMPCPNDSDGLNGFQPVNCIHDARIEYHSVSGTMDDLARYHSFFAEYNVCAYPNYTVCGTMQTGGWMDMGVLVVPYPGNRAIRPGGALDFGLGSKYGGAGQELMMTYPADASDLDNMLLPNDPYVSASSFAGAGSGSTWYYTQNYPEGAQEIWSMTQWRFDAPGGGTNTHNPYVRVVTRIFDGWNLVPPADVNHPKWICSQDPNFTPVAGAKIPNGCSYNGSVHALAEGGVRTVSMAQGGKVLPEFAPYVSDLNGVQVLNFSLWTDRYGNLAQGCTAAALDCIPFVAKNLPVGIASFAEPGDAKNVKVDYDTSPAGQRWIEFPN